VKNKIENLENDLQLICPKCAAPLQPFENNLRCTSVQCAVIYPVVNAVPILIDDERSLFSTASYLHECPPPTVTVRKKLLKLFYRLVPEISRNIKASTNYQLLHDRLKSITPQPRLLIIGGGEEGQGISQLTKAPGFTIVSSDVVVYENTDIVFDAHAIPFPPESFDAVIVQAVLEHVVDPYRCVAEIYRVLRPDGFVYAETPFMQQHHMGRFDFQRFTHLGHRRLFSHFTEIAAGPVCGPGMALAWSVFYYIASFTRSERAREIFRIIAAFLTFPLKYLDGYLIDKPGSFDAASGFFFLGQKADAILSDREIVSHYKGMTR
jgi:SAM-dependent methyltransferase/uncharacterized protein YbaR (Trm112 family)